VRPFPPGRPRVLRRSRLPGAAAAGLVLPAVSRLTVSSPAVSLLATCMLAGAVLGACERARPAGRYADLNGIHLYYELHGRGHALLLLHGGTGNGRQFTNQVPAFQRRFRLIVPDLCAQGRTTDRADSLTYHAMAEDMIALLDQLHVQRADVLGWSDGGIVGLDLAIHHPKRVQHLVTFGANFAPDGLNPTDVQWNATASADSFGAGTRLAYSELAPDPAHYVQAMNKIIAMWRTQPNFTPSELGSIRAKTLICAGEHDVVRREHTEQLARAIRGAELWIVPKASHSVILEQPELVNAKVLEFLRR
jgi:pimeloyl-ACP methyl ester carboxylesterase